MLKKALVLLMLGAAFSAPSWADWDHDGGYGRVIRVEPAISFGFQDARNHFQILYDLGGERYWTYADYYPGPWLAVPAARYVYPYRWDNHYYQPYRWDGGGHRHNGWDGDHWRHGNWGRRDHHGR